MMRGFTNHPFRLTLLAPLHIGSGDDLDWTQAVPDGAHMLLFDPARVQFPDRALQEISTAAQKSHAAEAIAALQRVFKANIRALAAAQTGRIRLSGDVRRKFEEAQRKTSGAINQLQLARHAFDLASGRPYIPGSSVKGALRTAEIACRHALEYPGPYDGPNRATDDPSDALLGRFADSPFARVMLADLHAIAPVEGLAAFVQCIRRRSKARVQNELVKVAAELIPPFAPGLFAGEIRMDARRGPLDLSALLQTTHGFHTDLFDGFAAELEREPRGLMRGWLPAMRELLNHPELTQAFREGRAARVRLGKFGSAESKTVAWRSVRNTKAKDGPQRMLNSTTLWLADLGAAGRLPLGWALIELGDTASPAVEDICRQFAGDTPEPAPARESVARPAVDRIVPADSSDNAKRLIPLEDEALAGRDVTPMLRNLAKTARNWPPEDRALFAQLYHQLLRDKVKPAFHQKELDKALPKPSA